MIFYGFSKIHHNIKYYWRFNLQKGPWILSESCTQVPSSCPGPWKEKEPCWVLGAGSRRFGLDSGEASPELGRGTTERGPGAHLRPKCGRRRVGDGVGEWVRRRRSLAAAAARFRRRGEHGLANMWHEEHQRVLGEASKASHDPGRERERESSAAAAMVARRRCASREEGAEAS
jgi:hypothetical protein